MITLPPLSSIAGPWPLHLMNRVGRLAGNGRSLMPLDPAVLMQAAERSTGLMDWGGSDIRPALQRLLAAFNDEAGLNTIGRMMLNDGMRRFLSNRLKMERDWTLHPDLLNAPVARPIFIIGLPRTGSTLLQRLLARAPGARALHTWEMMEPSAPPPRALGDTRIALARARLQFLEWAAPDFMVAHEVKVGEPEECVTLLQNSLVTDAFELMGNIPSYRDWVGGQNMDGVYAYYRRQLQLLQAQRPAGHWVLKSPFHQLGLDSVLRLFPDALIVQTHRDPVKVVPSWCSLFSAMHTLTSVRVDCAEIGRQRLQRLAETSERCIAVRAQHGAERFVDIAFNTLMEDPIAAVRQIHARAGLPLDAATEQTMQSWLLDNRQHKLGVHRYTLEAFGLDEIKVSRAMRAYRQRFAGML